MDKKNRVLVYKTVVWLLTVITIVVVWVLFYKTFIADGFPFYYLLITITVLLFVLGYFLSQRNLKIYKTDAGEEVLVFAGLYDHYIEVNGERVDEYKSAFYFTPINMSYNTSENEKIDVIISLTNKISVKINGKLAFPIK